MAHFIRISFYIVAVALTLAGSRPTPSKTAADYNIPLMEKEVNCEPGSEFYSPTEVKGECITSALECIQRELQVATKECQDDNYRIEQAEEALNETIIERKNGAASTDSSECVCEKWPQKSFQEFLDSYRKVIEQMNASL